MMFRTHISLGVAIALLFLPYVSNKILFFPVVVFCSILPDIDSMNSYLGQKKIFRPLQWLVKHRELLHSFSFVIIVSAIFAFYLPVLALPFFLGYSIHLIADGMTPDGIRPFWPQKDNLAGFIRTGGKAEAVIFYVSLIVNLFLLARFFV